MTPLVAHRHLLKLLDEMQQQEQRLLKLLGQNSDARCERAFDLKTIEALKIVLGRHATAYPNIQSKVATK